LSKILVIDRNAGVATEKSVADRVVGRLGEMVAFEVRRGTDPSVAEDTEILVYFPLVSRGKEQLPDLGEAERLLGTCAASPLRLVLLVSSAAVYGARPQNPGFIAESRPPSQNGKNWYGAMNRIAEQWMALEALAAGHLGDRQQVKLTILRPTTVLTAGGRDYFSRLFSGHVAFTLVGHDPSLQLLRPDDLAEAVCRAVERESGGTYNVAPSGVIPLRAALRRARVRRIPLGYGLQRLARGLLAPLGLAHRLDQLEYVRYSWTVANEKGRRAWDIEPRRSSAAALGDFLDGPQPRTPTREEEKVFDDYGMDVDYVAAYGRTLLKFLRHYYWRIEARGLEHVPRQGRAVLAGVHRGFMPLDAIMTFDLVVQELKRYPRFLIHPTLIKLPFQFNFMTKFGGVIACQENADRVLQDDQLLGFYPEGIHGAFTLYRHAYRLGKFGRNEFVKTALRNRAPIVPFVTVGSPEIFPIIGKIDWHWWKRLTQWPFFPIAPPFPLLPIPLPSKWHTQFLEPIHVEDQYGPEAAEDKAIVRMISRDVRDRMQAAVDAMLERRRSIFYGSVFEETQRC
jgi:1-acyl-sn-glycerol-3-phosphate acyltransferase/nucleoside-diphosphate-sugar epimerase